MQVQSTLTSVETPFGEKYVPDMRTVNRALQEDYNRTITYQLAFRRNPEGKVILDRQYNTAAMLSHYYGSFESIMRAVRWDSRDPNELSVQLPSGGGMQVPSSCCHTLVLCHWQLECAAMCHCFAHI